MSDFLIDFLKLGAVIESVNDEKQIYSMNKYFNLFRDKHLDEIRKSEHRSNMYLQIGKDKAEKIISLCGDNPYKALHYMFS
jgi:hypothetical protein